MIFIIILFLIFILLQNNKNFIINKFKMTKQEFDDTSWDSKIIYGEAAEDGHWSWDRDLSNSEFIDTIGENENTIVSEYNPNESNEQFVNYDNKSWGNHSYGGGNEGPVSKDGHWSWKPGNNINDCKQCKRGKRLKRRISKMCDFCDNQTNKIDNTTFQRNLPINIKPLEMQMDNTDSFDAQTNDGQVLECSYEYPEISDSNNIAMETIPSPVENPFMNNTNDFMSDSMYFQ